jgi:hypothetical protein
MLMYVHTFIVRIHIMVFSTAESGLPGPGLVKRRIKYQKKDVLKCPGE